MFLATVITTPIGHFIWLGLSGLVIGSAVWKNAKTADHNLGELAKSPRKRNTHHHLL